MAEERTLGLARASEQPAEDPSKEDLQRRLDEARDSISHTVTEIRESVASQVQAVKESLDWREQFKKRPVAWSLGAFGAGLLAGYGIAAAIKGDDDDDETIDYYGKEARSYAAQPILAAPASSSASMKPQASENGHEEDQGPGLIERLTSSAAYGKVRAEAGTVGEAFVQELAKTAKLVVVPALIKSIKNFLGDHLPGGESQQSADRSARAGNLNDSQAKPGSSYQPILERNQG